MTTSEFSNNFDILYNNITSNQAPGLDEYEKSFFLTKAQYEIIKNYFNPKGNKYQEGFDGSIKRQIDFSTLIKTDRAKEYSDSTYVKFDDRSILYAMPTDILFTLNETAISEIGNKAKLITIVPISFDEYARQLSKPYKQPLKNQGWRLFQAVEGNTNANFISEVIAPSNSNIRDYKIRYIKRPKPIILADLDDDYSDVSLEGLKNVTECELDPILHSEILQRAVELAKAAYTGDVNSIIELGKRSE